MTEDNHKGKQREIIKIKRREGERKKREWTEGTRMGISVWKLTHSFTPFFSYLFFFIIVLQRRKELKHKK